MKHLIDYSLYESASPSPKNMAHQVYTALLGISGLPEAFQEQMLLGRGNCAHGIMHRDMSYDQFKSGVGTDCPISREDFEEAQKIHQKEVKNYQKLFPSWYKDNQDHAEIGVGMRLTSHLDRVVPYDKLLGLLMALERSALSRGGKEIQLDDFKGREADYSLSHQSIDDVMNSGNIGNALEKIMTALGFDRVGPPNDWLKIK